MVVHVGPSMDGYIFSFDECMLLTFSIHPCLVKDCRGSSPSCLQSPKLIYFCLELVPEDSCTAIQLPKMGGVLIIFGSCAFSLAQFMVFSEWDLPCSCLSRLCCPLSILHWPTPMRTHYGQKHSLHWTTFVWTAWKGWICRCIWQRMGDPFLLLTVLPDCNRFIGG